MRSWLAMCAVVVLGLAFGYGAGFATSAVGAITKSPLLTNPRASRDNFTGVFQGLNRLAAAEVAGGACDSPIADYLSVEDDAISAIQDRAAAAGLNPPLDVARARLALRRARLAEKNNDTQLKTQYEEAAQQLLQESGWKDPSLSHLRQIVYEVDRRENTCSASTAKVEPTK